MILLMVAIHCMEMDRLRYVMIDSIHDSISHRDLERNKKMEKCDGQSTFRFKGNGDGGRERLQILFGL